MGFRLVPKSATLNDLERRKSRYFALFYRIMLVWAYYVKVVEDRPKLSAREMWSKESSFSNI